MEVIDFVKRYGVEKLKKDISISVGEFNSLLVFNYTKASPKNHNITNECRGLILDDQFNIVSRSFDRILKYNENIHGNCNDSYIFYERINGEMLIRIYYWNEEWNVGTWYKPFLNGTWLYKFKTLKDWFLVALGNMKEEEFQRFCNRYMDISNTYIFEMTLPNFPKTSSTLWYLAARKNNSTGEYVSFDCDESIIKYPKTFHFESLKECVKALKQSSMKSSIFVYKKSGGPFIQIINPKYLEKEFNSLKLSQDNNKKFDELVKSYPWIFTTSKARKENQDFIVAAIHFNSNNRENVDLQQIMYHARHRENYINGFIIPDN